MTQPTLYLHVLQYDDLVLVYINCCCTILECINWTCINGTHPSNIHYSTMTKNGLYKLLLHCIRVSVLTRHV